MTDFPYPESYHEFYGDVFEHFEARLDDVPLPDIRTPEQFYLIQTISGDGAMSAGIAEEINNRYKFRDMVIEDMAEAREYRKTGWVYDKWFHIWSCYAGHDANKHRIHTMRFGAAIGDIIETPNMPYILALVTKEEHDQKPTLETMRTALENLYSYLCQVNGYCEVDPIELIMPTIGCGLDRLNWDDVRQIIFDVFGEAMAAGWLMITVVRNG